jgi:hypothetical protein
LTGQPAEPEPPPDPDVASVRQLATFGMVDGLVVVAGLVLGLVVARQAPAAVWHAALGGAAGELVGMTAGQHLSDPGSGWRPALACGAASGIACVLPAVPYLVTTGAAALAAALTAAVAIAAVITWLRPERGWQAVVRTYGILIGAGLLAGLSGLL